MNILLLIFALAVAALPNNTIPQPCLGPACQNPKNTDDYQDFAVIRRHSDGLYFRYSKSNHTGLGLTVAIAPAFKGPWNYAFEILTGPLKSASGQNRSDTNLWAPEVHHANGTYYLFYGVFAGGSAVDLPPQTSHFDLCVATSSNMSQGSWIDHGSLNIPASSLPDQQYNRLDISLLGTSADNQAVAYPPFIAFSSRGWGIYGVYLEADLLSIRSGSTPFRLVTDQKEPDPSPTNNTNGAFQMQAGNYAYLFYHRGLCCVAQQLDLEPAVAMVEVCRRKLTGMTYRDRNGTDCSSSAFVNQTGTEVLTSNANGTVFAPGAVGTLQDPTEGLVFFYQYYNISEKAKYALQFGWNHLSFDAHGWPVLS